MPTSFVPRRLAFGAVLMTGLLGLAAQPAFAQDRMRVLVPPFLTAEGKSTKAGERLADQLKKQINEMPTHAPLDEKVIKDGMKKLGVKESDLDTCIEWRQLVTAARLEAGLVLCGTLDETTNTVTANFYPVGGGDAFDVPAFAMQSPEQGAQQVVQAFGQYVRGLTVAVSCNDYIQNQSWQQALDYCNQAIEINPKSVLALYSRGTALMNLDRNEEAVEAFKKVLEVDQINQDAMMAAGYVLAKLDRQDEAMQYFHQYLELNPGDDQIRLTIATRLANEGNPSAALQLVEEATAKPDATAQLFTYAGHFAMNAGLTLQQASGPAGGDANAAKPFFEKAITNFEKAMAMQPDSIDASVLRQLMLAYNGVGNTQKALEIGQRATAAAPNDAVVLSVYAEVLKGAGRTDEAIAALEKAAQLDATLPNLNARKGVMLLDAGRLTDAVTAFQAALQKNELPQAQAEQIAQQMAVKGFQATQAGRLNESMPFYRAARELGKSERTIGMINFFQGYTLMKQGEPIIKEGNNAAAGRRSKPLFEQAKALLESAGAYTEQAATRAQLLQQVQQFIDVADALIKAGR